MQLWKKMVLFSAVNLLIAAAAASAPRGYTSGVEYLRQKVVFDHVRGVGAAEPTRVILGDSRAECCIAAGEIGFTNLSLSGSTPVEGYYLLRALYAQGADVRQAILSYAPQHISSQDTFYSRTRYFGLVDAEFTRAVERTATVLGDAEYQRYNWRALEVIDQSLPFLTNDAKFMVVNVLSLDQILGTALQRLAGRDATPVGDYIIADPRVKLTLAVATRGVHTVGPTPAHPVPAHGASAAASPVNAHYLRLLVELARAHGTALSFLVMPFNSALEPPAAEDIAHLARLLSSVGLEECYSGIQYWPNELFGDATHLNQRGSDRFTGELSLENAFCEW